MRKSQADRSVIARRAREAGRAGATSSTEPVSRNLAARTSLPTVTGQGPRKGKVNSRAWAHRDATGRYSDWNRSPYYYDAVVVDARWSA